MGEQVRVLIAEDESLIADLVEHELRRVGMRVVGRANDGAAAVARCCELKPDVVLMDLQMPELSGLDAARRLQHCCPTPIVVLTAEQADGVLDEASQIGVGAYVVKPATGEELQRAITVARARFGDLQEVRRVNAELREALSKVKVLSGLLPICASCKSVRDDDGYWHRVDAWIEQHGIAECSHGICPTCWAKDYPDEPFPTS